MGRPLPGTRARARNFFIVLSLLVAAPLVARPGGDIVPILDVGVGGRALALGGAFTAISDDATALVYNPAGLVAIDGDELTAAGGREEGAVIADAEWCAWAGAPEPAADGGDESRLAQGGDGL